MQIVTIESLLEDASSSSDTDSSVSFAKRKFLDESDCIDFFRSTRTRLFSIEDWRKNSSATDYKLFDDSGKEVTDGNIEVGRFIRIRLYGGGKYDWVRVVSVVDDPHEVILTVKPTYDSTEKPVDTTIVSHFFGPQATNNFCLQRNDKTVAFYVIGIGEKQNTKFTDGLIESTRNVAVANIGYYSGLQKTIWKQFCSSFLKTDEERDG
jgi:hypothetical protein